MKQKELRLAYLFAILNAVIIGFSFLFTKIALEYTHPLDTLTYRFAASFFVMSIPVVFGWVKLRYRDKPLYKALLLAGIYPLGFFMFQSFGLLQATSAEGGIMYAFTPVVTMVFASIFLKEATTLLQKLSIFMSVFGIIFIFILTGSSIDLSNLTGLFLLFLTCITFAGYSVLARSLSKHFNPAELSYFMLAIGFAAFGIVSLVRHGLAGTLDLFFSPLVSITFITSILYLGILSSLVTALTANYVLSKIEASKMSVFTNLSTIVSIAAGSLFLGEKVTMYHLIGSLMIITGVIGANHFGQKKTVE